MGNYIMALDAGTTSSRCILFNKKGEMLQPCPERIYPVFSKTRLGGT